MPGPKSNQPSRIDVWDVIVDVLRECEPILMVAFFGYFYYHIPVGRLAVMLDESSRTVVSWLGKIQTDIKRGYRARGGKLGQDGRTISTSPAIAWWTAPITLDSGE